MKDIYFLITVDGDMRSGTITQRDAAIKALLKLFDSEGMAGKVTWFLNENDFEWTKNHAEAILSMVERKDALGIHDHFDTQNIIDFEEALRFCKKSYSKVMKFLKDANKDKDYPQGILAHRSGSFYQRAAFYKAKKEMGYRILQDVFPEKKSEGRLVLDTSYSLVRTHKGVNDGTILADNTHIPLEVRAWRHDVDNWLDYKSRTGFFLQIPATCIMIYLDFERLRRVYQSHKEGMLTSLLWAFHPYEIHDLETGELLLENLEVVQDGIRRIRDEFSPTFINIYDFAKIMATS